MFFIGQNLKHVHDIFFSGTFDLLLINSIRYLVWSLFLTASKKYCMLIQTPKETNHEIKIHTFLLVSDIDV